MDAGLDAILDIPGPRVLREPGILDKVSGAPAWAGQIGRHSAAQGIRPNGPDLLRRRPRPGPADGTGETAAQNPRAPLAALLGTPRVVILQATAVGATTGELARASGVSAASATRHTTVLRDTGLLVSHRHGPAVLHTLTPTGAALLRPDPA
ncbi:ArsR/SmtB family transcription factor [Streptomyces sp. GQFP]|uniref:ArsR/SmtB family transcription factor n=1 Tax=Streptomyces sp. GQFP TaxID=2907545 RepID=UPI002E1CB36D